MAYYVLSVAGLELGYHRHFTHRAFRAPSWLRVVLAICGATGASGPVTYWAATHRLHHSCSDREGDPHSPHVGRGFLAGLWHAHVGWMLNTKEVTVPSRMAPDLMGDRLLRRLNAWYVPTALAGVLLPFVGGALVGGAAYAWELGLWAGFLRLFAVQFAYTGGLNSVCHLLGRADFKTEDRSTNNIWLVLPTLGQSLHNNHHAFPRAAILNLRRLHFDPCGLIVSGLEALGVIHDVRRVNAAAQQKKLKV